MKFNLGLVLVLIISIISCKKDEGPTIREESGTYLYESDEKFDLVYALSSDSMGLLHATYRIEDSFIFNDIKSEILANETGNESDIDISEIKLKKVIINTEFDPLENPAYQVLESSYLYGSFFEGAATNLELKELATFNSSESTNTELVYDLDMDFDFSKINQVTILKFRFVFNNNLNTDEILGEFKIELDYNYEVTER